MLKPNQFIAIEILVAGGGEDEAANAAGVARSTLWRWKYQPEFAMHLQHRTGEETEATRRLAGADIRARVQLSKLGTQKMTEILFNPKAPLWMQFYAAHSAMKNGRWANDKVDPEFRRTESTGEVDDEHKALAGECTRKIAAWEHRDRFLAQLQQFEERRVQQRTREREDETLRRLNILAPLGAQDQHYMVEYWRRNDDHDERMEEIRREKARKEFAAAAEIELHELPPKAPLQWADLKEQFKDFILPSDEPATPQAAEAEIERAKELSYPDPNSPAEKKRRAQFEADFKATEADYRANILPKVASPPIERLTQEEVASPPIEPPQHIPPLKRGGQGGSLRKSVSLRKSRKRWSGPIPDQDSPDRQAYLDALPDDAVPQLSIADRRHKEDWDRRRARSEANERRA